MKNTRNPLVGIAIILVILFVAAAGSAGFFYKELAELKKDPQKKIQEETQTLLDKVGRLVVLPEGEQPTIATVSDAERLKDQPFFAKAKNGDKVLIYPNARKAILYDPISDKVIEIAPVNIGNAQSPSPTPPEE